jgi:hypothetical protein
VIFFALLDRQGALIAPSEAQSVFLESSPCKTGAMRWVPLLHLCPPGSGDARSHDLQFEAERNKNTARKLRTRDPLSRSDALAPRRQWARHREGARADIHDVAADQALSMTVPVLFKPPAVALSVPVVVSVPELVKPAAT